MSELEYKVVELSTVVDDQIEKALNEHVRAGWVFESMHFAMHESSKRPAMVFLLFTRGQPAFP